MTRSRASTSSARRVMAVILLALALLAASCGGDKAGDGGAASAPGRDITVADARRLLAEPRTGDGAITLVDVRTPDEFASGRIDGATNIDVSAPSFADEIGALDRNREYVVYCHSGNRSNVAVTKMEDMGFTKVHNVLGGVQAWEAAGFDLVT